MALSSVVKSLTEAAFPQGKASTPAPTQVAATHEIVDKAKDVDPTSDAALSLSSSFPTFDSFKDQRAFEHDRQRVKRSEDYARTQEVKASKVLSKTYLVSPLQQGRDVSTKKNRRICSGASDNEDESPNLLERARSPGVRKEQNTVQNSDVKLADLIKPGSTRKSRKNKDADFELIPAVRPVIVLDELAFMHDTPTPRDLEQEWQHVYHSDGDDSDSSASISTPTYANIVIGGLN